MRRLLLCLVLMLCWPCSAYAAEYNVTLSGTSDVLIGACNKPTFQDGTGDNNYGRARLRVKADLALEKNIQAALELQVGEVNWGSSEGGGSMASDDIKIRARQVYIGVVFPDFPLEVKGGILEYSLPSSTFGNPIFDTRMAGVLAKYSFGDSLDAQLFFFRPYENDRPNPQGIRKNNEMDVYGISFDYHHPRVQLRPWYAHVYIGGDSGFWPSDPADPNSVNNTENDVTRVNMGGLATDISFSDKLSLRMDAMYGRTHNQVRDYEPTATDTRGFLFAYSLDYQLAFARLSLIGWYASGDRKKDSADHLFGQLPTFATDGFAPTMHGFAGSSTIGKDGLVSMTGTGTRGIGLELADIALGDKLSSTLRIAYYEGTNEKGSTPGYFSLNPERRRDPKADSTLYMTEDDSMIEFDASLNYKIYEKLSAICEVSYLMLDKDDSVDSVTNKVIEYQDCLSVLLALQYTF